MINFSLQAQAVKISPDLQEEMTQRGANELIHVVINLTQQAGFRHSKSGNPSDDKRAEAKLSYYLSINGRNRTTETGIVNQKIVEHSAK